MSQIKILATLGPKTLNENSIKKINDRNIDYLRINLSHTSLKQLESHIELIQKYSNASICIDTEGAQVRNCSMNGKVFYKVGQKVKIVNDSKILGNNNIISIRPKEALKQLIVGSIITIDFDGVMLLVDDIQNNCVLATVVNNGYVVDNRAITFFPFAELPPLSKKDKKAIKIAKNYGINCFALSFTNSGEDVKNFKRLTGKNAFIISKIETKKGVENLNNILDEVDAILIDRGDLSREVPSENIPYLQKTIIKKARSVNKHVYVATNLLESMLNNKNPTRAEVNDVANTLIDGANGLVLAAETAIGNYPIESIDMLRTLIKQYNYSLNGYTIKELINENRLLLPKYHGTTKSTFDYNINNLSTYDINKLESLHVDIEVAMDAMQILSGAYSPIKGFMSQDELFSVLNDFKLINGAIWPMPIILQIKEAKNKFKSGNTVLLREKITDKLICLFHVKECYELEFDKIIKQFFGTDSKDHPGVNKFINKGNVALSGELELIPNVGKDSFSMNVLSPKQTRMIFTQKGWSNIIGFHTRNVPHKGHEFLIKNSLEKTNADGILIHPIIGPKKTGDFKPEITLSAYDILVNEKIENAIISGFPTYPRYAGPREAIFTAICRKNYGCKYFIVGRDHTGVGSFYNNISIEEIFNKFGNIGLKILFYDEVVYDLKTKKYQEISKKHKNTNMYSLKGTDVRKYLTSKKNIPDWLVSKKIKKMLNQKKYTELFEE